jgi:hypothetical protein
VNTKTSEAPRPKHPRRLHQRCPSPSGYSKTDIALRLAKGTEPSLDPYFYSPKRDYKVRNQGPNGIKREKEKKRKNIRLIRADKRRHAGSDDGTGTGARYGWTSGSGRVRDSGRETRRARDDRLVVGDRGRGDASGGIDAKHDDPGAVSAICGHSRGFGRSGISHLSEDGVEAFSLLVRQEFVTVNDEDDRFTEIAEDPPNAVTNQLRHEGLIAPEVVMDRPGHLLGRRREFPNTARGGDHEGRQHPTHDTLPRLRGIRPKIKRGHDVRVQGGKVLDQGVELGNGPLHV